MPPVEVRDPGVQYKRVLGGFVLTTQDLLMKKAVVWYEGETTPGMKKRKKKKFGAQGFTCDSNKNSQYMYSSIFFGNEFSELDE